MTPTITAPTEPILIEAELRRGNVTMPVGRSNWLFAGSLRAGQRAAAVMTLLHSARLNGLDPWRYLKVVMQCLPTQPASRIAELLP